MWLPLSIAAAALVAFSGSALSFPSGTCAPYLQGNGSVPCWSLDGSCYCFPVFMARTWMRAEDYCRQWGMALVSLETWQKNDMLKLHIMNPQHDLGGLEYWTSGRFNGTSRRWEWTSIGQTMDFTDWYPGQPNEAEDTSCVLMFFVDGVAGLWADNSCRYATHFICEEI